MKIIYLIQIVCSVRLVEYRFWNNFGEVFYDYTSNGYVAVNGINSWDNSKNTLATDRGAYFQVGDSRITLPPNDQSSSILMPSVFSFIFWGNFQDYSYYILYRASSTILLYIKKYTRNEQISIRLKTSTFDSLEIISNSNVIQSSNFLLRFLKLNFTIN